MPRLDEVFKKSGIPELTFVEPAEYARVVVALQTPGRGIIIEGPSGIGKTSCLRRAIDDVGLANSCTFLSARKASDIELISELPSMQGIGIVAVDDFHRLTSKTKTQLTDLIKVLADEEVEDSKVILIGINQAGQALVEYAPDLLHRVESIRFGRTNIERIQALVSLGEHALNCSISIAEEIAEEAEGSFAMAQVLSHEACLKGNLTETCNDSSPYNITVSLPLIRESVLDELRHRFFPPSRSFATGKNLYTEGRAPYLNVLKWLSETQEGVLDTREGIAKHPKLKASVGQIIKKGYLSDLINSNKELSLLFHFDQDTQILATEDPKLLYFLRHITWSNFARQVGYYNIDFKGNYDFALSFAGEDRCLAEAITNSLTEREISVFYDKNEQHRILANDVEEYLAPIYRSESRFVIVLLSRNYPQKNWTKFESDQFKHRFGENAVIPIRYKDMMPDVFSEIEKYGGLSFDPDDDLSTQVDEIVQTLVKKIEEARDLDSRNQKD